MKLLAFPLVLALALLLPSLAPLARGQSAKFTTLYEFGVNGDTTNGELPLGGPIQGKDGNLYGTTSEGGTYGGGTAYKLTPGGVLTILQRFGNNNGTSPQVSLLQGGDGNFYGTTYHGGTKDGGTVFQLTASGKLTILHRFTGQSNGDGANTARAPMPTGFTTSLSLPRMGSSARCPSAMPLER